MATGIVTDTLAELRERGIYAGARVGSTRQARRFGTVSAIRVGWDQFWITWDDGKSELLPETAFSALFVAIDLLLVAAERARRLASRQSAVDGADNARVYLTKLIEQRQHVGRIVAAQGGQAIEDERCRLLDEQIARLRANLTPVSFRDSVAA